MFAAARDRLCGGNCRQHYPDRDLDAGFRFQHDSAAGCVPVWLSTADALDVETTFGLFDRSAGRPVALRTLAFMHVNPAIPTSLLFGFLLVLARISGVFVYLPLPGLQAGPSAAKIVLSMILTFGMYSRWPALNPVPTSMVQIAGWMLAEAAIGLATGLAVGIIIEAILFAAQAISTQAGFAYAS